MSFDISMCESICIIYMLKKVMEALNTKLNKIKPTEDSNIPQAPGVCQWLKQ